MRNSSESFSPALIHAVLELLVVVVTESVGVALLSDHSHVVLDYAGDCRVAKYVIVA